MVNTVYPPVTVVDENDREVGSAMLADVWRQGLYHRIVSVFLLDDKGRMLLQLRDPHAKIYPSCWDQAASGHVDEGFSYDQAATTELEEEVGLRDVTLEVLGTFRANIKLDDGRLVNQFERAYLARVPYDTVLKPELEEVSEVRWFTSAELRTQIAKHPKGFTPGLLHALRLYFPDF